MLNAASNPRSVLSYLLIIASCKIYLWYLLRYNHNPLPHTQETYLKKLSLHAYRIIDDDVDSLRTAGYSEEMIYEITLVGAVGTAPVGLEMIFAAMYD